jgi:DNA mismatch endonuclease (patch repair protein)|tara:strand:+ start:198 stop:599 length:402 start_codon:yes stop_codon:yes gene_type:complete
MDTVSKKKRSEIMSNIRSKNTKPELEIRKYLHSMGFRYSLHKKDLPGTPDIFLKKYNLAIQVRGCFWHGHKCNFGSSPKSNKKYWLKKIKNNIKRDAFNDRKLKRLGIQLVVIRECKIKGGTFEKKLQKFIKY